MRLYDTFHVSLLDVICLILTGPLILKRLYCSSILSDKSLYDNCCGVEKPEIFCCSKIGSTLFMNISVS